MTDESLSGIGNEVVRVVKALNSGQKLAGIRLIGKSRLLSSVNPFTLMGSGWTLYVSTLNDTKGEFQFGTAMQLFGDRTRFEEDLILAKMSIC